MMRTIRLTFRREGGKLYFLGDTDLLEDRRWEAERYKDAWPDGYQFWLSQEGE